MTLPAVAESDEVAVYIDFDSCYYNISRRLYRLLPWTVVTNKFNHIISVPHWLEGHLGVKKIAYLAPPVKVKLKVSRLVRTFCIDKAPSGRSMMTEYIENELEKVGLVAPDAHIVHKDSITVKAECSKVGEIKDVIGLPCTVGIGPSEEEAIEDYRAKKRRKKDSFRNTVLFLFWLPPMILCSILGMNDKR